MANYPNTINEVNLMKQTPLHLAVGQPSCVALLLRASGRKLIDLPDSGGWRPMEYALFSCLRGTRPGENNHHDGCLRNHGDNSLDLILHAGCMIPTIDTWPRPVAWPRLLCDTCQRAVSTHLVARRKGLKTLAANNIPRMQATALGLFSPWLCDSSASRAIQALRECGILVPPSLEVDGFHLVKGFSVLASPYHYDGPMPFSVLWSIGFRDLEASDFNGVTPLMNWCKTPWLGVMAAVRCSWLIDKGANLWKLAPDGVSTIGHELYSRIGELCNPRQRVEDNSMRHFFNLTQKLSHRDPRDSCRCACSNAGCTPFVRFLQAALRAYSDFNHIDSVSEFIGRLPIILKETHTNVTKVQMRSAVRYVTFETLGIRHTCCHADPYITYKTRRPDEELDELRQEDHFLVARLENLVAEFEVELDQMGRERYVNRRVSFWQGYWLPRMQQVLDFIEGAGIEDPEKAAAEEIGVVWHEHESDKGKDRDEGLDSDSGSYNGGEVGGYHESDWDSDVDEVGMFDTLRTMEDWTSRLDLIMSKAGLSAVR